MTASFADARTWQLLELLADGEFHSGEALGKNLGLSRASVCYALDKVADFGVILQRIRGRGYRLARPWQRLDEGEISRWLGKDAGQFQIEILQQAASSNTLLLRRAGLGAVDSGGNERAQSGSVLAVEMQTAGRGRMGRAWHSGLGSSLTFSLLWRFDCGLNVLSGLSLAIGVAQIRALKKLGVQDVKLKWPNDILTAQGKLGGVLIEAQGDMLGPSAVVIGSGLNYVLPEQLAKRINQPASALEEVSPAMPSRSQLLAVLLQELAQVLRQFARDGFSAFREEWERYHIHQDKPVQLHMPDDSILSGIARGVSDNGELCIETAQGIRRINSGEIGLASSGNDERTYAFPPLTESGQSVKVSG